MANLSHMLMPGPDTVARGAILSLAAPPRAPYLELGRSNFQMEVHRDVSGRGVVEQSKTPVGHDIGPGLRLVQPPVLGPIIPWRGQVSTQLQSGV